MKDSVQQNSRSSPKTMVLNQELLSEAESFFLKGKSIQILIFKMVMVILNFNILRHGRPMANASLNRHWDRRQNLFAVSKGLGYIW